MVLKIFESGTIWNLDAMDHFLEILTVLSSSGPALLIFLLAAGSLAVSGLALFVVLAAIRKSSEEPRQ